MLLEPGVNTRVCGEFVLALAASFLFRCTFRSHPAPRMVKSPVCWLTDISCIWNCCSECWRPASSTVCVCIFTLSPYRISSNSTSSGTAFCEKRILLERLASANPLVIPTFSWCPFSSFWPPRVFTSPVIVIVFPSNRICWVQDNLFISLLPLPDLKAGAWVRCPGPSIHTWFIPWFIFRTCPTSSTESIAIRAGRSFCWLPWIRTFNGPWGDCCSWRTSPDSVRGILFGAVRSCCWNCTFPKNDMASKPAEDFCRVIWIWTLSPLT